MQSAGLVLWLLAVCACHPDQAPPRPAPLRSTHQRPRANLLALVRAAATLHPRQSRLPAHAHYHVAQGAPPPSAPQDEEPLQPQETGLPEVPTWAKRSEATSSALSGQQEVAGAVGASGSTAVGLPQGAAVASTFLRHARSGPRPYDVPRIDCPAAEDQMERFPCPSPDRMGRYRCIDDHVLCDGFIDCPDGEDEDRQQCMFYKTTKAHLDVLADAIIRWARGGK